LQMGMGLSAAHVGTLLLPAGLALAGTIAMVGRLADRQPPHRLVQSGLALLALSFAAFGLVDGHTPLVWLVALVILGRVGLGFVLPSLNLGALRGLPAAHLPAGSSAINVLRMLGGSVGVSLSGVVLQWRLAVHGATIAAGTPGPRLAAFAETFGLLAALCALACWRARALGPTGPQWERLSARHRRGAASPAPRTRALSPVHALHDTPDCPAPCAGTVAVGLTQRGWPLPAWRASPVPDICLTHASPTSQLPLQ
ncbi:MAG: MFS transporter, partial [Tepidimonas ignava]